MVRFTVVAALLMVLVGSSCLISTFEVGDQFLNGPDAGVLLVDAGHLKPNVMLLVDRSGSMSSTIPGMVGATRISELKSAMGSLLSTMGQRARFGLAMYPTTAGQCTATVGLEVPLPPATQVDVDSELISQAASVNSKIQATAVVGGTPTAVSLAFVARQLSLNQDDRRADYIILVTDGLPNCNDQNAHNICSGANTTCRCTQPNADCGGSLCSVGCLDEDASTLAIKEARARGITVVVIGFGTEPLAGDGPATLNAMAAAGGFARTCPGATDAECGAGASCDPFTHECSLKFYRASNAADLSTAITDITSKLIGP